MKNIASSLLKLEKNENLVYVLDSRAGLLTPREIRGFKSKMLKRGYEISSIADLPSFKDEAVVRYFFPWMTAAGESVYDRLRHTVCDALDLPQGQDMKIAVRYNKKERCFQWTEIQGGSWLDEIAPVRPAEGPEYGHVLFRMVPDREEDFVSPKSLWSKEEQFSIEMDRLEKQAQSVLTEMFSRGYSVTRLKSWIDTLIQPSRLFITAQYRIYLVDYDNIEVKMKPLPKAVFIFFLRHPEGCMLSDLYLYREELRKIYSKVCRIVDKSRIEKSVDYLVDPFNNSICEKCSAIKSAFISYVSPDIARFYYVSGPQGRPKKIALDPAKVLWESD